MLLIPCPWCGPRDEIEFRYGGEAHIARPADPDALDDSAWADYLFMRANPKGVLAERWVHRTAAGAGSTCCATRYRTASSPRTGSVRRGRPARFLKRCRIMAGSGTLPQAA